MTLAERIEDLIADREDVERAWTPLRSEVEALEQKRNGGEMTLAERVAELAEPGFVPSEDLIREVEALETERYALEHPLVNALVARFGLSWPDRILDRFQDAGLVPDRSPVEVARLLHEMKRP